MKRAAAGENGFGGKTHGLAIGKTSLDGRYRRFVAIAVPISFVAAGE